MNNRRMFCCLMVTMMSICSLSVGAEETKVADYSQQLPAFTNQVSVWKPKSKGSYAYTDLDQNGSLEVLTSHTSKKGVVTNELWEQIDGKLTECELPWGEGDEQTELKEREVPVYYDEENDIYYYLFGTASEEADTPVTAIWLKDGVLSSELLEEDAETRFSGLKEFTGSIGWINTAEHTLNDAPLEQLGELGGESISGFKLKAVE